MAKATVLNTTALSVSEAAAAIVRLVNESPRSPRQDEIAAVIAKTVATPTAMPQLSSEHLEFRKIVAEIARFEDDVYPPGMTQEESEAALNALSDQAIAIERKVWARPAQTLADVLLRGEIALYNENGVMEFLDVADAYEDDRANAQLIQAVVDVLGGQHHG